MHGTSQRTASALLLALSAALCAPAAAGDIGRFRITGSSGNQANGDVLDPAVSDSALVLAYSTNARNLGIDHGTGAAQIFVQDALTDAIDIVSRGVGGEFSNGNCYQPSLSADARFVAFICNGTNLVAGEAPGVFAVYRRDRQSGLTQRVSNGIGAVINGQARYPTLSADGRYVAYYSAASIQIPGDTNGFSDLLLTDMQTGASERLSVSATGAQSPQGAIEHWMPALSADARFAVFASASTNLVPSPSVGSIQVYLRDRQLGSTQLLSVNAQGQAASSQTDSPSISANGRYVVYRSFATNLVAGATSGVYRLDRSIGSLLALPTPPNAFNCSLPTVSSRGDVSYLCSDSGNGLRQAWLFQPPSGLFMLSESVTAAASNGSVETQHALGANGSLMAFASTATDIVSGDTNGETDTFVAVDVGRLSGLFADGFE
ncbi:TolB family protein [Aquimonas sp.]|jgi:hypothetical protein|uniref:TolB family protein n=1 Tax=Aquimonas sp. TaxID=1872588 RepID=UPI0037BE844A